MRFQTKPPRLLLRFAIYAGVALIGAAGAALLLARSNATARANADLGEDAKYLADELSRDDLAGIAFRRPVSVELRAQLDDLVGRAGSARDVLRVSLYSPDGWITYSTDHELIGRRADVQSVREALGGADVHSVSDGSPRAFESYVPVRWLMGDPRTPTGVMGVFSDYEAVASEIRRDVLVRSATILLALLLLYAALFPILRRVTASLAASEARHRALTEQASDGILCCDRDGTLIEANSSLAELTGYPVAELLGMNVRDLIADDDLERLPLRFAELLAGKTVLQERKLRRKDGKFFYGEFHGTMLADGRIHASLRDVTQRKELEQELREAHTIEAQARLAGGVATDFDKLLDAIEEHSERVLDRLAKDDPLRENISEIRHATTWGSSLVQELLAFGGKQELRPEVLDVDALVSGMEQMLRLLLGKRVELVLAVDGAADRVAADRQQLEKMLVDLVLHARDSMPRGGTVTVSTANVDFEQREGRLASGRFVMLAVSDTGAGTKDTRLFEPYSGEEVDELIGPGLAAVYGVVQQSGGSIGLESEPGRGTTVRVYLPSVDAAEAATPLPRALGAA